MLQPTRTHSAYVSFDSTTFAIIIRKIRHATLSNLAAVQPNIIAHTFTTPVTAINLTTMLA